MTQIVLKGVTKRFGKNTVVKSLDLDIASGEFLVLLGPSGCGKTTTMRMIAGLEPIDEGEIRFNGERVNETPAQKRDVAMVFQNYGLYPHMTVERNIGYPLKLRGLEAASRQAAVAKAAKRVDLQDLLARFPRELSGGQRQRVALARSIVRTPRVFLMDEPLSNLDAKLRVAMRAEIKHLVHEMNVTTLYVTHDQIEAMTLAHRVALMNNGQIEQLAAPEVLYNAPATTFVAGFIGNPAMNLLPGHVSDGHWRCEGLRVAAPQLKPGAVTLGIRAEDITLASLDQSDLQADVFSFELLGDAVLLTVRVAQTLVAVKADRSLRFAIGERVGLCFNTAHCNWFDSNTGRRIV